MHNKHAIFIPSFFLNEFPFIHDEVFGIWQRFVSYYDMEGNYFDMVKYVCLTNGKIFRAYFIIFIFHSRPSFVSFGFLVYF